MGEANGAVCQLGPQLDESTGWRVAQGIDDQVAQHLVQPAKRTQIFHQQGNQKAPVTSQVTGAWADKLRG